MESELKVLTGTVSASVRAWMSGHDCAVAEAASSEPGPVVDTFEDLLSRCRTVEEHMTSRSQCLPLKLTMELLEVSQRLWASTLHHRQTDCAAIVPAARIPQARFFITFLFLLAHNFFAPEKVRDEYLRHHLAESEKAVLMCLQTAKRFIHCDSDGSVTVPARKMLGVASVIVDVCSREKAFNAFVGTEVAFAELALAWHSREPKASVEALATSLVQRIDGNRVYEELFLQFVLTCRGRANGRVDEEAYRALLALSLRVVDSATPGSSSSASGYVASNGSPSPVDTARVRTFRGTVLLQLALSHLREENCAAAAESASAAASLLDTVEPLVVKLKALANQGLCDDAFNVFVDVARRLRDKPTVAEMDELFTLAVLLADTNPTLTQRVATFLTAPSPEGEDAPLTSTHLPRVIAFLLHANTDACAHQVVRLLGEAPRAAVMGQSRFYFSCLCSLHAPTREPRPFPPATVIEALLLALQRFSGAAASFDETEVVLTELAGLVLAQDDDVGSEDNKRRETLTQLLSLLEAHADGALESSDSHQCVGAACIVFHAQVLLALDRSADALAVARRLLSLPDAPLRSAAFGRLINDRLDHGDTRGASNVAEIWLLSDAIGADNPPPAATFVEIARVYVAGLLARYADQVDEAPGRDAADSVAAAARENVSSALLDLLVERVTPALQELLGAGHAMDVPALGWWCTCFWYVAQLVMDDKLSAAVSLTHSAVEWFDTVCAARGDAHQRAMLTKCLTALLGMEFDLFVADCAWLTVPQLQGHLTRLTEWLPQDESLPLNLFLARAELEVRRLLSTDTAEEEGAEQEGVGACARLHAHAGELKSHGAAPEDLEALAAALERCSRKLPSTAPLRATLGECAVQMELMALQILPHETEADDTLRQRHNILVCYKAYQMARRPADRLRVVALALDALQSVAVSRAETTAEQDTLIECVAEFFTVEAWNYAVYCNATHDRPQTLQWKEQAVALSATLTQTSVTRSLVTEFAAKMPLM